MRRFNNWRLFTCATISFGFFVGSISAATVVFTDRSSWEAAATSGLFTEDFESASGRITSPRYD